MRNLLLFLITAALWSATATTQQHSQPSRIAISELKRKLDRGDKFLLIDVREDQELAQEGAIPGAIHIPLGGLDRKMADIPKDVEVVFYCATGRRAALAAEKFLRAGYQAGPFCGIADWKKAGFKVVPGAERPRSGPIRPKP